MFGVDPAYWILSLLLCATIGGMIGARRKQAASGAVWSLMFGPVGWLIALLLPDRRDKCPHCKGALPARSVSRCMHCGGPIAAPMRPPGGGKHRR